MLTLVAEEPLWPEITRETPPMRLNHLNAPAMPSRNHQSSAMP